MEDFQAKARSNQTVKTIQDMKAFVENYPMFKKMSGTVATHVNVVQEMSSMMEKHSLMDVSELEQDIVSIENHSDQLQVRFTEKQFLVFRETQIVRGDCIHLM